MKVFLANCWPVAPKQKQRTEASCGHLARIVAAWWVRQPPIVSRKDRAGGQRMPCFACHVLQVGGQAAQRPDELLRAVTEPAAYAGQARDDRQRVECRPSVFVRCHITRDMRRHSGSERGRGIWHHRPGGRSQPDMHHPHHSGFAQRRAAAGQRPSKRRYIRYVIPSPGL